MRLVYSFLSETVIVGANGGIQLSDTDNNEHVEVESEADVNEESWENGEATGNLASCPLASSGNLASCPLASSFMLNLQS